MGQRFYNPETLEKVEGLRLARKCNGYPSVTTATGYRKGPGLIRYLVRQTLESSLTLPHQEGESLSDYSKRISEDSKEHASKAADFGTVIHNDLNNIVLGNPIAPAETEKQQKVRDAICEWYNNEVKEVRFSERSFIHPLKCYAGTLDLLYEDNNDELTLLDAKTQAVGPSKNATFYPEWVMQLSAYADMLPTKVKCKTLVLDSHEEGFGFETKEYSDEELDAAFKSFLGLLENWKYENKYYPKEHFKNS